MQDILQAGVRPDNRPANANIPKRRTRARFHASVFIVSALAWFMILAGAAHIALASYITFTGTVPPLVKAIAKDASGLVGTGLPLMVFGALVLMVAVMAKAVLDMRAMMRGMIEREVLR
jgi:hypothetical protein